MTDYIRTNWKYLAGAALLHALFAGIFALTLIQMARDAPPPQLAIQAVVIDAAQVGAASRRQEREKEEERERVQQRREQEAVEQKRQQEQAAQRETEQRAEQERQVELKRRQEEEQKRVAEQQMMLERQEAERKQQQAEAERQKKAEAERQRVAEIERKQKEEAQRRKAADDARLQKSREAELQRQLAEEEGLMEARGSTEFNQYVALIQQQIERNWNRPMSARPGLECKIHVAQSPNGVVLSARVEQCNGDAAVKQSIEQAVLRASPLPPPPNPRLFERNLILVFKPSE